MRSACTDRCSTMRGMKDWVKYINGYHHCRALQSAQVPPQSEKPSMHSPQRGLSAASTLLAAHVSPSQYSPGGQGNTYNINIVSMGSAISHNTDPGTSVVELESNLQYPASTSMAAREQVAPESGHCRQACWPRRSLKKPGSQSKQASCPWRFVYFPTGQSMQELSLACG